MFSRSNLLCTRSYKIPRHVLRANVAASVLSIIACCYKTPHPSALEIAACIGNYICNTEIKPDQMRFKGWCADRLCSWQRSRLTSDIRPFVHDRHLDTLSWHSV